MREIIIHKYIADDGTEFDTQEECTEYEQTSQQLQGVFFTLMCNPSRITSGIIGDITYIIIRTKEQSDTVKQFLRENGISISGIIGPGYYKLDFQYDEWDNIEDKVKHWSATLNRIKEAEAKYGNQTEK